MFEQYSIIKDLGYVEVINSADLQICMTRKSMSEFDRVNPCFYLKVSYNEEVLSMYHIYNRGLVDTNDMEEDMVLVSKNYKTHALSSLYLLQFSQHENKDVLVYTIHDKISDKANELIETFRYIHM